MTYSNKQMNEYMKNRYRNRRKNAIDYLGGSCSICGSLENLEFHHKDPTQKNFTIAQGSSFSNERFWSEINLCVLLCNDCHVTHHHIEHPCGDVKKYWQGCKCDDCKLEYAKHTQDYRNRRRST